MTEDGLAVTEAAAKAGVTRQTLHAWLGRYAAVIVHQGEAESEGRNDAVAV